MSSTTAGTSTDPSWTSDSSSSTTSTSTSGGAAVVSTTMAALVETLKTFISSTTPTTTTTASSTTAKAAASSTAYAPTTTTASSSSFSSSSSLPAMQNVAELSSSLQHFGIADYCVFVLMLIVCAVIGFYFGFIEKRKKKRTGIEERRGSEALDYLVGGRKMKVFPVSLSLVASFVSGISLLGTSTEIYVYGTQYAFILVTLVISGVISWYVFLPVFCNLQLTSTYEYFEIRFDRRIRLFGSVLFVMLAILWMPISIYVPALTFNQVTGINVHIITPVVCVVCTLYTCVGGVKGVIWTDVLQAFIMVGSMTIVIIKGTIEVGGLGVVYQRNLDSDRLVAPEFTFDPTVRMGFFAVFVGGALFKLQGTCISQIAVQRFLSLPDMKAVKKTIFVFTIGLIFLLSLCIYLGLLTYAAYYDCDPITTKLARAKDQVVPLYVMQTAGQYPGLVGLFVSGVFSAALSSLSTALNSLSGVILKDFIEPYRSTPLTERQTAIILRAVVVFFGFSSIAMVNVVEKLGMVMQLSATVGSMSAGPLLGLFTLGMLMPFVNTKSVLTGCSTAAVFMSYIAIRSQVAIASGELSFPTKSVSVEGCTYEFDRPQNSSIYDIPRELPSKGIHHISFLWYTMVGAIVTIVVSLLATLFFGRQDTSEVHPDLVVPFVRRFMKPLKYKSVTGIDVNAPEVKKEAKEQEQFDLTEWKIVENCADSKN